MHAFCAPDLRKAVWPWLKDDQQYSNGDSDLLQLQVVCHSSPAQNPANTLLRGHCDLTQANGQTVQFRWWQTESLQHGWRQTTCNITDWDWVNQKKRKRKALCDTPLQWGGKMVWFAHGLESSNYFLLPVLAACSMSFLLADKISSFLSVRRSANAQMMSLLCGQTYWYDIDAVYRC